MGKVEGIISSKNKKELNRSNIAQAVTEQRKKKKGEAELSDSMRTGTD